MIDRVSIETLVGTKVSNVSLYQRAFTHKSALKNNESLLGSFETLEFIRFCSWICHHKVLV